MSIRITDTAMTSDGRTGTTPAVHMVCCDANVALCGQTLAGGDRVRDRPGELSTVHDRRRVGPAVRRAGLRRRYRQRGGRPARAAVPGRAASPERVR